MKQKLTATLLLLMAGLLTLSAQINFSVSYKRVDAKTIDIIFSGTAAPGWHIYSNDFAAGGPTRASFGVDVAKGAKPLGALKPGPGAVHANDPIFDMPVSFFVGKATFTQRIELTEKNYE